MATVAQRKPKAAQKGQVATAPPRQFPSVSDYRTRAASIRQKHSYKGKLTNEMLLDLGQLLNEPIDPRYIKTIPAVKGKPYESTGISTVQVQVDRLNAVLGESHWTKLLHYEEGGVVCHAHIYVGNNVGFLELDKEGHVTWRASPLSNEVEILMHRSGWGGHDRGSNRGDLRKGAETNALKRAIAQAGPGHDVYCLDFDEDVNPTTERPRERTESAGRAVEAPADPTKELEELLAIDDELKKLRGEADEGMRLYGLPVDGRVARLKSNATQGGLEELKTRINLALEERES